jgi:hypothetical protein
LDPPRQPSKEANIDGTTSTDDDDEDTIRLGQWVDLFDTRDAFYSHNPLNGDVPLSNKVWPCFSNKLWRIPIIAVIHRPISSTSSIIHFDAYPSPLWEDWKEKRQNNSIFVGWGRDDQTQTM